MNESISFFPAERIYTYFSQEQALVFFHNAYKAILESDALPKACKNPGAEVFVSFQIKDIALNQFPSPFTVHDRPNLVLFMAGILGHDRMNVQQIAFYNNQFRNDKQAQSAYTIYKASLTDSRVLFDFHT